MGLHPPLSDTGQKNVHLSHPIKLTYSSWNEAEIMTYLHNIGQETRLLNISLYSLSKRWKKEKSEV